MHRTSIYPVPTIPTLSAVKSAGELCLEVTWCGGARAPRTEKVDLAPVINSLKIYKPLRSNQALFDSVHLLDGEGDVIAWGANDEIDMSSETVEHFAEEMMTPQDFREFLTSMDYTHQTAAAMLGYSRRQVENLLADNKTLPRVIALACIALTVRSPASPRLHAHVWISTESPEPPKFLCDFEAVCAGSIRATSAYNFSVSTRSTYAPAVDLTPDAHLLPTKLGMLPAIKAAAEERMAAYIDGL